MIHDTQSAQISQKQDGRNIYVIMKTMCPHGYHNNGFVATHALDALGAHMIYGSSCAQVHELPHELPCLIVLNMISLLRNYMLLVLTTNLLESCTHILIIGLKSQKLVLITMKFLPLFLVFLKAQY